MVEKPTKMDDSETIEIIAKKLTEGEPFGLFGDDAKVYFRDGTKVRYTDLWKAIRVVKKDKDLLSPKTLFDLFPETFVGSFGYRNTQHKWHKN